MIAMILSLSMVDFRQRQWRLSQHAASNDGFWTRLTDWSHLHPEPYQDVQDSTWKHIDKQATQTPIDPPSQRYYTRKKHRAVAKLELGDALAMRGRVLIALIIWGLIGLVTLSLAARRLSRWLGYP